MSKRVLSVGLLILFGLLMTACSSQAASAAPAATLPARANPNSSSAEGHVEPVQSVNLSFGISGEVAEVRVKAGDAIKAGDVIARLKSEALKVNVTQAEAALAAAKANLSQYQAKLPQQIAAAGAQIKAAQAQIAAGAAQRNNDSALIQAEAAVAQAQYAQQSAQTAYDKISTAKLGGETEEKARLALSSAIMATRAAQARVDELKAGSPNDRADGAQIAAASASQTAAQAQLDELQAEAAGKVDSTFAAAVKQAEAALLAAQTALADTELRAPISGTIAQLNLKAGERITPGAVVVTLADFSSWQIKTDDLTEIKVAAIKSGQAASIRADALPDVVLKGQVEAIEAVSQLKNGDVTYPVTIKLIDTPADPRLRWGMTVAVTFEQK